jgi:hypothetical protein
MLLQGSQCCVGDSAAGAAAAVDLRCSLRGLRATWHITFPHGSLASHVCDAGHVHLGGFLMSAEGLHLRSDLRELAPHTVEVLVETMYVARLLARYLG